MLSKKSVKIVSIIMGSQSDYKVMKHCQKVLKILKIKNEVKIVSAHRTPSRMYNYAKNGEPYSPPSHLIMFESLWCHLNGNSLCYQFIAIPLNFP